MAEKSVAQKLWIKPGQRVRLVRPPENAPILLGELPAGAVQVEDGPAEVTLIFLRSRAEMEAHLPGMKAQLDAGGALWVAYVKGTSRLHGDIHRDSINAYAGTLGMTGVMMISIDDDWSALRLKLS